MAQCQPEMIDVLSMTSFLNTCVMRMKDVMEELVPIMNIITLSTSQKKMMVGTSISNLFIFVMMLLMFVMQKELLVMTSGWLSKQMMTTTIINFTMITHSLSNATILRLLPMEPSQ